LGWAAVRMKERTAQFKHPLCSVVNPFLIPAGKQAGSGSVFPCEVNPSIINNLRDEYSFTTLANLCIIISEFAALANFAT
jgi:hypothetical protein